MDNLKIKILIAAVILLFNCALFSQAKKQKGVTHIDPVVTSIPTSNETTNITRDHDLEKKIQDSRLKGNKTETERFQKELIEKYQIAKDESEIKTAEPVKGNLFNSIPGDLTTTSNVTLIDSATYLSIQGAISEQTGNNTGRIWNVYMVQSIIETDDTLKVWYSDDNGINWNLFGAYIWQYPDFETIASMMDLEIAINSYNNDKMLYAVFTCYQSGTYRTGIVRVDVGNHPGQCSQTLFNFGSFSTISKFVYARAATDNASYHSNPYIFLSAYETYYDNEWGWNVNALRYAVIMNPFELYGAINYSNGRIATLINGSRNYDFCSFNIGFNDYVFFVEGDLSSTNKNITAIQYSIYDALAGGTGMTASVGNNYNKLKRPCVSSDGTNIVIAAEYELSPTDIDLEYFKSSSGITGINIAGFIDNSSLIEHGPSITSKWNSNDQFICAYNKSNASPLFQSIYLAKSVSALFDTKSKMVSTSDLTQFIPGNLLYTVPAKNDECFVTWIDYGSIQEVYSITGCSGIIAMTKEMNLKFFFEGFYRSNENKMSMNDTVKVYLRKYASPYNIIDSANGTVHKDGTASLNFGNAESGVKYFVVVKHRNTIETWSKPDGIMFIGNYMNFDFSLSNGQSYGANQHQVDQTPIAYAMFSGDVNQDGIVDATDAGTIDNDAYNFVTGYKSSDLTGDNVTDATDAAIVDNNAYNFVSRIRP